MAAKENRARCEGWVKANPDTLQEKYNTLASQSQQKYVARRFRLAPETARVVAIHAFGEVRQQ